MEIQVDHKSPTTGLEVKTLVLIHIVIPIQDHNQAYHTLSSLLVQLHHQRVVTYLFN